MKLSLTLLTATLLFITPLLATTEEESSPLNDFFHSIGEGNNESESTESTTEKKEEGGSNILSNALHSLTGGNKEAESGTEAGESSSSTPAAATSKTYNCPVAPAKLTKATLKPETFGSATIPDAQDAAEKWTAYLPNGSSFSFKNGVTSYETALDHSSILNGMLSCAYWIRDSQGNTWYMSYRLTPPEGMNCKHYTAGSIPFACKAEE